MKGFTTGRHVSLLVLVWGDPVLMVRRFLCWLRSYIISGAVCACVSTCLLLHCWSACQVRDVMWQIYLEQHSRSGSVYVTQADECQ